jgi:hypothetical protein
MPETSVRLGPKWVFGINRNPRSAHSEIGVRFPPKRTVKTPARHQRDIRWDPGGQCVNRTNGAAGLFDRGWASQRPVAAGVGVTVSVGRGVRVGAAASVGRGVYVGGGIVGVDVAAGAGNS